MLIGRSLPSRFCAISIGLIAKFSLRRRWIEQSLVRQRTRPVASSTLKTSGEVAVINIARRSGQSTSGLRSNVGLIVLQRAQLGQRPAAVDLLTRQGNPVIQIAGQSADDKSTRGVDHHQVALRSGYFPSQNPFQASGIFLPAAPAQLREGASRDPKPMCIKNRR